MEIVTRLDFIPLEKSDQDMAGVKGRDAALLDGPTRHDLRILSIASDTNTMTCEVDASLKSMRRGRSGIAPRNGDDLLSIGMRDRTHPGPRRDHPK